MLASNLFVNLAMKVSSKASASGSESIFARDWQSNVSYALTRHARSRKGKTAFIAILKLNIDGKERIGIVKLAIETGQKED